MYLHLKGQVAHLVQKGGTLVGALKHAHLSLFAGPGEGPLLIAEQLALDQLAGMAPQLMPMKLCRARAEFS